MATSSNVVCGFSYRSEVVKKLEDGKEIEVKEDKWDRIVSVKPIQYELYSYTTKDRLENWNTSIQTWLKRYIFFRICPEAETRAKPKLAVFAANMTFMVSAFWHGFYPKYYFAFF